MWLRYAYMVNQSGAGPAVIGDVIAGCVNQAGARHSPIAGRPGCGPGASG
jgi:hypothetical protein